MSKLNVEHSIEKYLACFDCAYYKGNLLCAKGEHPSIEILEGWLVAVVCIKKRSLYLTKLIEWGQKIGNTDLANGYCKGLPYWPIRELK